MIRGLLSTILIWAAVAVIFTVFLFFAAILWPIFIAGGLLVALVVAAVNNRRRR